MIESHTMTVPQDNDVTYTVISELQFKKKVMTICLRTYHHPTSQPETCVVTGRAPFVGLENSEIFVKVGVKGGRTPIPAGYAGTSEEQNKQASYAGFVKLVEQMWNQDLEARPGFDSVVKELENLFEDHIHDDVLRF